MPDDDRYDYTSAELQAKMAAGMNRRLLSKANDPRKRRYDAKCENTVLLNANEAIIVIPDEFKIDGATLNICIRQNEPMDGVAIEYQKGDKVKASVFASSERETCDVKEVNLQKHYWYCIDKSDSQTDRKK